MMRSVLIIGLAICCVYAPAVSASESKQLIAQPESTLRFDGDSTLHAFSSKATQLLVSAQADSPSAMSDGAPVMEAILKHAALKKLEVVIPVRGLKSGESGLDKNMYRALKAEACPEITFHLSSYEISPGTTSGAGFHGKTAGTLKIACQEQPVTLETDLNTETGALRIQGHHALLMSHYGIKPPSLMMGAIKVKDPVVIHFDLQLTTKR